jgi:CRISPR system Cascade subunit CasA
MTASFNLVDSPWIPCGTLQGDIVQLGLMDTLVRAHELREIADPSPLIVASLHRLALAVLHRVFGPSNRAAWGELWRAGHWPGTPLQRYFERWYDRFDLFHPEHPFFQASDERVKPKSVLHLIYSGGNNPTLFSHETDEQAIILSAPEAARALLASQTFHIAGLSGLKEEKFTDAPWTRGVVFLAQGETLFHTLALNLIRYPEQDGPIRSAPQDRPVWEADDPFTPDREYPLGYLDYLTWPNVRVKLLPEEGPAGAQVRSMTIAPGLRLSADQQDPMKLYWPGKKEGWQLLRFSKERSLWRSLHTFLALRDSQRRPPVSLNWLAGLVDDGWLSLEERLRYMALGMSNNQAKIDFYRQERFPLPLVYLQRQELVGSLERAIDLAEQVASSLNWALEVLAQFILSPTSDQEGARKPDRKQDIIPLVNHWGGTRPYWQDLEPRFWELVDRLPENPEAALENWKGQLQHQAVQALDRIAETVGTAPEALKGAVEARRRLFGKLKKLLE